MSNKSCLTPGRCKVMDHIVLIASCDVLVLSNDTIRRVWLCLSNASAAGRPCVPHPTTLAS
eukprot:1160104-Pelagomonas_calceolata.AAC.7